MRIVGRLWWVVVLLMLAGSGDLFAAWPWGGQTLATINGEKFTTDDFDNWWKNWKEPGFSFPESPDPFVDWHLLVQEAKQMELYNEPSYRHKIDVFLKARTLLIYKGDKINSQVKISEKELKELYQQKHLPRLKLQVLYFNDKEKADQVSHRLQKEEIDLEQFAVQSAHTEPGSVFFEEKMTRMSQVHDGWSSVVQGLSPGETSSPFSWSKGFVIIRLIEKMDGDPEDFDKLRKMMENELREKKEAELTRNLVEQLKKRYQVTVDWQVFDAIDLDATNEKLLDKTLITMDNGAYSVGVFLGLVKKEQQFREKYGYHVGGAAEFKKKLLDGVLAQTLTSRGALDEHYEERDPLKPLYTFYSQHRLNKELEKRLFKPKVQVTDDDVEKYYHDHLEQFSQPEMVSIAVLEDEENLIQKMYGEMKRGDDFFKVGSQYYSGEIPVQRMEFKKLDPVVQAILNKMVIGEISEPFTIKGHHTILKLVKRLPSTPMPLDHVEDKIRDLVEDEKFNQVRDEYLDALKERAEITVSNRAWEKLLKEYQNARKEN